MSDDPHSNSRPSRNDDQPQAEGASRVNLPSGSGPELDRLPPPVFPPGQRRGVPIRHRTPSSPDAEEFPDDAFFSPDEPIRSDRKEFPDDAFISPDEPIAQPGSPRTMHAPGEEDLPYDDEVVVTGIGDQAYARVTGGDAPTTGEELDPSGVAAALESLADELREEGGGALTVKPGMTPFQSVLRGFLAGYLVGRGD